MKGRGSREGQVVDLHSMREPLGATTSVDIRGRTKLRRTGR